MSSSATHTSTGEKVGQALTRELWAQGLTEHEACAGSNFFLLSLQQAYRYKTMHVNINTDTQVHMHVRTR